VDITEGHCSSVLNPERSKTERGSEGFEANSLNISEKVAENLPFSKKPDFHQCSLTMAEKNSSQCCQLADCSAT
jgi:hypothetical protein